MKIHTEFISSVLLNVTISSERGNVELTVKKESDGFWRLVEGLGYFINVETDPDTNEISVEVFPMEKPIASVIVSQ